jgi:hypothetical protein
MRTRRGLSLFGMWPARDMHNVRSKRIALRDCSYLHDPRQGVRADHRISVVCAQGSECARGKGKDVARLYKILVRPGVSSCRRNHSTLTPLLTPLPLHNGLQIVLRRRSLRSGHGQVCAD